MNTKALRQKILDLAIHGKLVPQDPNDEPASVLLERIKAEKERLIKEGKIKRPKRSKAACDKPHYPYQLPKGWVWTTLGEICHFENGFAFNSNDYKGNGTPLIRISNIVGNSIDLRGCVFVQKEVDKRFLVNKGNLLIALSGATTGKMGIYASDEVAYLNQRVGNLKIVDATVLHPQYRDLFMLSKTETILKLAYGGAQPNISGSVISSFLLPLPPFAEQQRIVKEVRNRLLLLDSIENEAETLHKSINRVKSKILDLAIHGKLVQQDPNDEPASELLKRINPKAEIACDNAHYRNLPKGWAIVPMQMLCSLVDGEMQSGIERINLDVKFLRGERGAKRLSSGKYTAENTLLILVDGENSGEVFCAPIEGYQGSTLKQLAINKNMNTNYVLQIINLHRKTLRENKVGSAIPHLDKKLFKAIEVPVPPYEEQQRIVNAINKAFTILNEITESL